MRAGVALTCSLPSRLCTPLPSDPYSLPCTTPFPGAVSDPLFFILLWQEIKSEQETTLKGRENLASFPWRISFRMPEVFSHFLTPDPRRRGWI